jgi:spore coat protein CotF
MLPANNIPPYVHQVMLDTDGDQQVSQQEFLAAAKDCMEAERAMSTGGTPEIRSLLQQTSAYLTSNQVGCT